MIHKSKYIKTLSEVKELIAHCKTTGYASIDYETNAREPRDPEFRPTILSVSFQPGSAWVIPLAHKDSIFKRKWRQVFKLFASEVLQDRTIIKIAWNAKFEQKVSMALGYRIMGRLFDPMLLKYLLDETPPNDLKSQVDFLLPEFGGYDLENQPGKKASREAKIAFWENVPLKELSQYGALDADLAFRLFLHYDKRVMELGLYHYSRNFYGPLTHILSETELEGVQVDKVYLEGQVKSFANKLDNLESSIRSIPFIKDYEEDLRDKRIAKYIEELEEEIDYGDLTQAQINNRLNKISKLELGVPTTNKEQKLFEPINFNSNNQLAELLYGDDGFGFECTEYTETGNPSCAESALKGLRGEDDTGFINSLLEHRELTKMYTTYLKGIYENHLTDWGTIHPGYLFHGTTTGRFSSRNPSFQTMPRSTTAAEIKRQFTMDDGFFFVEFDGCIPGYVKISTKRGLIPMEEVGPQDQVLLGDKFYQVLNQWSTGIKDVFEITTNTGRKIQATSNHPFLTPQGWVELGKLRPGDILTLDTSLSNPMRLNPNYLESYVAGIFYGDGFYSQNEKEGRAKDSYVLSFSLGNDRSELMPILEAAFPGLHIQTSRPEPQAVKITSKVLHSLWSSLYPKHSSLDMRIPPHVWGMDVESKLHFIGGLIDSDGSVNSGRINYSSRSEGFIDDLLILGQSVGVYGIKTENESGGYSCGPKPSFHWIVYSKSSISTVAQFSRLGRKRDQMIKLSIEKKEDKCRTELVPKEVYQHLLGETISNSPYKPTRVTLRNSQRKDRLTIRSIERSIIPYVPESLSNKWSEIMGKRYEVIESIEYLGKDKVYDLEVQGSHAFVANGVIVHNSQMELRMAAELSGDDNMLSIFHNNQNIHAMTAALLTGKPYELINSLRKDENHPDHLWAIKEHKKAKVLNFTILYGAGPPTVSEFVTDATGTFHSKADAQEMIDQWFEAYPKVAQWIKKQHKFSINHGYLVNPFGRRRRFPILLNSRNKNSQQGLWNEALRQGPNAVIQGGSSDITQWVNIAIQRERLNGNLPRYMRLISTVHDSLEYPVHKDDMAWVLPKVIEIASSLKDMKKFMGWTMTKVQMKFSCEFGINWGTMHEFDPGKKHKDLDFSKFYDEEIKRYNQEPYPHKWKLLK